MTTEQTVDSFYRRSNLKVAVVGFPHGMPAESKTALRAIFEVHTLRITGIATAPLNRADRSEREQVTFTLFEKANKAFSLFIEHWATTYVDGKEHSLNYGVPATGIDLLFTETNAEGTEVVDAWFVQNAIPHYMSEIEHSLDKMDGQDLDEVSLEIVLKGFPARNAKVSLLATTWLKALLAAMTVQKELPLAQEPQSAPIAEDDVPAN